MGKVTENVRFLRERLTLLLHWIRLPDTRIEVLYADLLSTRSSCVGVEDHLNFLLRLHCRLIAALKDR